MIVLLSVDFTLHLQPCSPNVRSITWIEVIFLPGSTRRHAFCHQICERGSVTGKYGMENEFEPSTVIEEVH